VAADKPKKEPTLKPSGDGISVPPSIGEADSKGLSREEIAELGSAAATALSDPMWKMAFEMTLNQLVASWLQSSASETAEREDLYRRAVNLQDLEEVLVGVVNQLQQQNLSEQERADQDLNRFDDEQGFGLDELPGFLDGPLEPLQ